MIRILLSRYLGERRWTQADLSVQQASERRRSMRSTTSSRNVSLLTTLTVSAKPWAVTCATFSSMCPTAQSRTGPAPSPGSGGRKLPSPDAHASGVLSSIYSKRSPGLQLRQAHTLSSTSTGMCFAAPVQMAEIVGGRIPVASANSFWVMFRSASITFVRNLIMFSHSL